MHIVHLNVDNIVIYAYYIPEIYFKSMTEGRNETVKKRLMIIALALCVLLVTQPLAIALSRQTTIAARSTLADAVVRQVNMERAKRGLGALRTSAELNRAARVRAYEITRKFSHTRPDGSAWHTVSSAAYGENIAMGQRTADKVMAAWMTSSGHRANILRASYGSIGVCAVVSGGVTYWVQLFGK